MPRPQNLLLILFASLLISFLLYGNTLKGEFLYDDTFYSERQELRRIEYLPKLWLESYIPGNPNSGTYRPLTLSSFALNFILFGESMVGFHGENIILNGVVGFLVFTVIYSVFGNKLFAAITSLLFLFLPIHTEAVAFIKSRDELLAAVFALSSWICFLQAGRDKGVTVKWLVASVFLYLLAVFSKETLVIFPVVYLLVLWFKQKPVYQRMLAVSLPYLLAFLGYLALRYAVLKEFAFGQDDAFYAINPLRDVEFWPRTWTAFKIAFLYIAKTFIPYNLSATYAYKKIAIIDNPLVSLEAILGFLLLLGLIAILFRAKSIEFKAGSILFLVPYFMVSKFLFLGGDIAAERWMYLPSLGLCMIAGFWLAKLYRVTGKSIVIILLLILGVYGFVTVNRNKVWHNPVSLYKSMIQDAPESVQGYTSMARYYFSQGAYEQAKPFIEKGMEIYDSYPPLLAAYAYQNLKEGDTNEAKKAILRSLEIQPGIEGYIIYAMVLTKQGNYKESIDTVNQYLHGSMNTIDVRFLMAINYYKLGDIIRAKEYINWNIKMTDEEKLEMLRGYR